MTDDDTPLVLVDVIEGIIFNDDRVDMIVLAIESGAAKRMNLSFSSAATAEVGDWLENISSDDW